MVDYFILNEVTEYLCICNISDSHRFEKKKKKDHFRNFESTEMKRREELETKVKICESRFAELQVKNEQLNAELSKQVHLKNSQAVAELEKVASTQKKELTKLKDLYNKSKDEISKLEKQLQQKTATSEALSKVSFFLFCCCGDYKKKKRF